MVREIRPTGLQGQIAEEIRVLLVRRRMTARELAEQVGWSQSQLSRKLSGQANFSVGDLEKVADAFGVPAAAFLVPGEGFITRREWSLPRLALAA